ncbi:MAG TPA: tetratricopeptide repeat protein, partial [Ktedonobacteraceae bacterium]|nr:tetratricopeptide repeat protein [Ktedonobacteraceae bacterium]
YQPNLLLRQARLQRGWSQQHLADLLGAPGAYMVNRWEQGSIFPSQLYRDRLCTLFHMQPEDLGLMKALVTLPELSRAPIIDPTIPIPSSVSPFVGRDALLAQIKRLLCTQPTKEVVALHGLPGVGKTTLAAHLAFDEHLRARFVDGVLWAGLGPRAEATSHLLRWRRLLGLEQTATNPLNNLPMQAQQIRQAIGERHLLIILDDAWELEAALACLVGGPHCGYLLTTRSPEIALRFALQQTIHVPELSLQEGIDLLMHLSPALQQVERTQVQGLVQAVGGLPLALLLMGIYLLTQSYHQQPRRLERALTQLQQAQHWLQLQHPQAGLERDVRLPQEAALSLQTVIRISEAALESCAQQALSALAVLPAKPQSFSEEAALVVAETIPETLDRLLDAGLVENAGAGRYFLHQTIAEYAKQRGPTQEAELRLISYVTHYVQCHQQDNQALERESSLIQHVLEIAPRLGCEQDFIACVCAVASYLHGCGLYAQMEQYLLQARDMAQRTHQEHELLTIIFFLSSNWLRAGRYIEGVDCLQGGVALAQRLHDLPKVGLLLGQLGHLYAAQGRYDQAEKVFQEALALPQHDQYTRSSLLNSFAMMESVRGKLVQAEAYAREGLALARPAHLYEQTGFLLASLGSIQGEQGAFEQAEVVLSEAYHLARTHKNGNVVMILLVHLGGLALKQDDYPQAEARFQEALTLAHQAGTFWKVQALCALGLTLARQGRDEQAQEYLQQGWELVGVLQQQGPLGEQLAELGEAWWLVGDREQARSLLLEGYTQTQRVGQGLYFCRLSLLLGLLKTEDGRFDEAHQYVQEGLEQARVMGTPLHLGLGLLARGEWLLTQHRYEEARSAYQECLHRLPAPCRQWRARAYEGLARLEVASGPSEQAAQFGEKANALLSEVGHRRAQELQAWLKRLRSEKF